MDIKTYVTKTAAKAKEREEEYQALRRKILSEV